MQHVADAAGLARHVLPVQKHLPFVGAEQAGNDVKQGGLSAAAHPQQAHQLPLLEVDGHITEDLVVSKGQADVAYFQLVHGHFWGR